MPSDPSIFVEEQFDSQNGSMTLDSSSRELVYLVGRKPVRQGQTPLPDLTANQAVAEVLAEAPESIEQPEGGDVFLNSIDWEAQDGGHYLVTCGYSLAQNPDGPENDFDFSFDTTGGSQKITQSFRTVQKYAAPGKTAPDFGGAIGVNNDSVEGCEIPTSAFKWTETHYIPIAAATMAYAEVLENLTGHRNAQPFRNRPAGAVIFEGAQGGKKDSETAAITFHFKSGKHATGLQLGEITGIEKKAWDYLWVRYEDDEDTNAKTLVKKPVAAYVEEVTLEADFSQLGIGTS